MNKTAIAVAAAAALASLNAHAVRMTNRARASHVVL